MPSALGAAAQAELAKLPLLVKTRPTTRPTIDTHNSPSSPDPAVAPPVHSVSAVSIPAPGGAAYRCVSYFTPATAAAQEPAVLDKMLEDLALFTGREKDAKPARAGQAGGRGEGRGEAPREEGGATPLARLLEAFLLPAGPADECTQLHLGWWSYQYCPQRGAGELTQFHVEQKRVKSNRKEAKGTGAPKDEVVQTIESLVTLGRAAAREYRLETSDRGDVVLSPAGAGGAGEIGGRIAGLREQPAEVASLAVVRGVLVKDELKGGDVCEPDAPSPTAASIPALLERELGGTCLQMRDGWWTYELCYGGMLRQFHSEAVSDSKGKQKMVQTGENALGVFEGAGKGGKGGGTMPGPSSVVPAETWREQYSLNAVDSMKAASQAYHPSAAYFQHPLPGGSVCEEPEVTDTIGYLERSAVVRYYCGSEPAIVEIDEVSSCKYVVSVAVKSLCDVEGFGVSKGDLKSWK
ncbi:hypothetical protein TeGR_g1178, partial [Tetraparma gracilis]